jgi:hypothetical protein
LHLNGKRLEIPASPGNDKPSMQPPLLPIETLARVLRMARLDGMGALLIATFFALTAAAMGEIPGATMWLLVAGMGAVELHGMALLAAGRKRGINWVIASQYLLLLVVLAHCALRLGHYDPTAMRQALTEEMKSTLAQANYDEEDFLRAVYIGTYCAIAAGMLVYKLSLARYYHRRRAAVIAAVDGAV